jgi:hypothetical protein
MNHDIYPTFSPFLVLTFEISKAASSCSVVFFSQAIGDMVMVLVYVQIGTVVVAVALFYVLSYYSYYFDYKLQTKK